MNIYGSTPTKNERDFQFADKDFSICQQKIECDMKYTDYLVYSRSMKTYLKKSLRDSDVKAINTVLGMVEKNVRFCLSCKVEVCLGDWPEHIATYYHQINLKFHKMIWGCCWYKNKFTKPHQVKECSTCLKQTAKQKERRDLDVEDLFFYKPESDEVRLDYLEQQKVLSSTGASDRYSCLPCGKLNLSKDYDVHLTGRAHKEKMGTSHGRKTAAPPKHSTGSKKKPYYINNKRPTGHNSLT